MNEALEYKFIEEFAKDFQASAAAQRAGYPRKNAGRAAARILKNPRMTALLEEKLRQRLGLTENDAGRVLGEIEKIAFDETNKPSERLRALEQYLKIITPENDGAPVRPVIIVRYDYAGAN